LDQKKINNINGIREGLESTRVIIGPKSVRPHRDLFINNLHHRVSEKGLPARVSRPPYPAIQTGLTFQEWPLQKRKEGNEIFLLWAVIIQIFLKTSFKKYALGIRVRSLLFQTLITLRSLTTVA